MKLLNAGMAGTMESNDIMITVRPTEENGVTVSLTSNVMQQFGTQIEAVIRETLNKYGVDNAEVIAVDKGALDCTIRARATAAVMRAANSTEYGWEAK